MRKVIAVAALSLAVAVLPLLAQAPQSDTFTLNPVYVETIIPGASYITWTLTAFDGNPAVGSEIEFLATGAFTFAFPAYSLTCAAPTITVSSLNPYGATYQTQTVVENFVCRDANAIPYAVHTVADTLYAKTAGVRGRPSLYPVKKYPIQGTVTY